MTNSISREKLIQATRDLLWERGLASVSPRNILDRAGVGQGSLYHYFKTKRDLVIEAIRRNADELLTNASIIFGSGDTAYRKIEAFLDCGVSAQMGCKLGNLAADHEVMSDAEMVDIINRMFQSLAKMLEGVLAVGIAAGQLPRTLKPLDAAWMVIAMLQGGLVCAKVSQSRQPYESAIKSFLCLLR